MSSCKRCGAGIPATGRPGRPASICAQCKGVPTTSTPAPAVSSEMRRARMILEGTAVECGDCGEVTALEAPFDDVARRMALVRHRTNRKCAA